MKNDLKILAAALEKKLGKAHVEHDEKGEHDEFVKHDEHMGKMIPDEHHKAKVLHKVWDILKGKEKPSVQTLNRLALLAGFQSWADFQGALHGTDDGLVNYSAGE